MKYRVFIVIVSLLCLLTACRTNREFAYISDAERDSAQAIITSYSTTVHPGDRLYIYVSSQTPESVIPFNEETNKLASGMPGVVAVSMKNAVIPPDGYLVDQQGRIHFPFLGSVEAAGITTDSLGGRISRLLYDGGFVNDAVVTVSLMNFRVAVIGEVARPREIHVPGTRLTIFEAIAMCGDLTIHGRRENIIVVRQVPTQADSEGSVEIGELDLTSKDIFNSPYYYLQQGDIVYVEPDESKKRIASRDPSVPDYISLGVSSASIIARIGSILTTMARRGQL